MGIPTAAAPPGTSIAAVAPGTAMTGAPETATAGGAAGTATAPARQANAGLGRPGPVAAGSDSWRSFTVPRAGRPIPAYRPYYKPDEFGDKGAAGPVRRRCSSGRLGLPPPLRGQYSVVHACLRLSQPPAFRRSAA